MPKPTLEEVYSLTAPSMRDDNFDFSGIKFSDDVPREQVAALMVEGAFQQIRLVTKAIHWREHINNDSVLTIVFMETLSDQRTLDAFFALKNEFAEFVFNIYDETGAVDREIVFTHPEYLSAEMALDAAGGKPVNRVMQFTFVDALEVKVGL